VKLATHLYLLPSRLALGQTQYPIFGIGVPSPRVKQEAREAGYSPSSATKVEKIDGAI
jgi:hypothetical protein